MIIKGQCNGLKNSITIQKKNILGFEVIPATPQETHSGDFYIIVLLGRKYRDHNIYTHEDKEVCNEIVIYLTKHILEDPEFHETETNPKIIRIDEIEEIVTLPF